MGDPLTMFMSDARVIPVVCLFYKQEEKSEMQEKGRALLASVGKCQRSGNAPKSKGEGGLPTCVKVMTGATPFPTGPHVTRSTDDIEVVENFHQSRFFFPLLYGFSKNQSYPHRLLITI